MALRLAGAFVGALLKIGAALILLANIAVSVVVVAVVAALVWPAAQGEHEVGITTLLVVLYLGLRVRVYIVVAVLAYSVASSFALADERALNVGCHFSGENMVSLDITLIQNLELPSDKALDLMVSDVIFVVHSESGGFWIQLEQPVLLNLKFELCEILQSEGIKFEETNVGRFLVEGMAISTDEPVELWGRCKNFPLPLCDSPE